MPEPESVSVAKEPKYIVMENGGINNCLQSVVQCFIAMEEVQDFFLRARHQ
jgi:hypothetical protein